MERVAIENTDIRASRLSLGTASLHHIFSARQRQRMLESAASLGISHFDTSPYYGYGLSESDLGSFMQGRRHALTVATKVGLYPCGMEQHAGGVWVRKMLGKLYPRWSAPEVDWNVERARDSLEGSLRRLRTDHIDFLFLHEPDIGLVNAEELLRWLETERKSGKVRYWGLAGLPGLLEPWLNMGHPLTAVIQTKDSIDLHEADFLTNIGRGFQFTYGYLSSAARQCKPIAAMEVVRKALLRNRQGSILVSTRKVERLQEIAGLVA